MQPVGLTGSFNKFAKLKEGRVVLRVATNEVTIPADIGKEWGYVDLLRQQ